MAINKDLGAVSAYAIAVENGFQGTVEEWLESLRYDHSDEFVTLAGKVEEDAELAAGSAQAAELSKQSAAQSANAAKQSAEQSAQAAADAGQIVKDAETAAIAAINEAEATAVSKVSLAGQSQVDAVNAAGTSAVSDIGAAKTDALTGIDTSKTDAVGVVNSAGAQAASDAQTAITAAKNQAVSGVESAGQSAVEKVQEAQTSAEQAVDTAKNSAVQAVQNAGTEETEKISSILPVPTADDVGKVPVAKPDGSGYELGKAGVQIDDTKTALDTTWSSENIVQKLCPPFTTEGAIVICNPVENSRLNAVVQIEPVQEGTGDPSPENIRPISGWDTVNVCRCGKNLLSFTGKIVIPQNVYAYNPEHTYPEFVTAVERLPRDVPVYFKADWSHFTDQGATKRISLYTEDSFANFDENKANTIPYGDITEVFLYSGLNKIEDCTVSNICVNVDNDEYEPYRGETFTLWLGHPVYGGTLDMTTGVLIKTHENIPSYAGEEVGDDWISSTGGLTNGAQVVYRLPQPEIIQLDPVVITAFSGVNTVYADTGDVTVSGYSDPNTIIDSLADRIAALESAATNI